jgi:hypothetical protein
VFGGGLHDAARPSSWDLLPGAHGRAVDLLPWTPRLTPRAGANGLVDAAAAAPTPAGGAPPFLCLHLLTPFFKRGCRRGIPWRLSDARCACMIPGAGRLVCVGPQIGASMHD